MNIELAQAYFERVLGPAASPRMVPLSPWEFVAILWPLNAVFRPHIHRIRTIRYRSKFEPRADEAIETFADQPDASTWEGLHAGTWRVLLERHQQAVEMALANDAASRNIMTYLPESVPANARLPGLMLLWLHSMELRWSPTDRASLELPEGDPPVSLRLQ